jgi:hypothetical protein
VQSKIFTDETGVEIAVNRNFVCDNMSESIFTLPQANTVNQGFNLTFDLANTGNVIFEVANTVTDSIRFGSNRLLEIKFTNVEETLGTLGEKQFSDTTSGISLLSNNSVLVFSGQQNLDSIRLTRISNTEYMLSR